MLYSRNYANKVLESINRYDHYLNSIELIVDDYGENHCRPELDARLSCLDDFDDNMVENRLSLILPEYKKILYSSFVVALYSFFEQTLEDICQIYEKHINATVSLDDLKGVGIFRSYRYFEKVVGLNLLEAENYWNTICTLKAMRNELVHVGFNEISYNEMGSLSKNENTLRKNNLWGEYIGLFDEKRTFYGSIEINKTICSDMLSVVRQFLYLFIYKLPE